MTIAVAQPSLSIEKIRDTLYQRHPDQSVSYADHLGEGPRHFDSDPRLDWSKVNCTTWWQQIVASGYASNDAQLLQLLDEIRYYFGQVSYGTRKHFLDRALLLDPAPFVDTQTMDIPYCEGNRRRSLTLALDRFKDAKGYACSLYREEIVDIELSYLSPNQTHRCTKNIPSGIYLLLPIASDAYLKIWGKESGPMGHVHGFLLDKDGTSVYLHHASLDRGKVTAVALKDYLRSESAQLFDGYKLYALQPYFYRDPQTYAYNPNDIRKIQHCETKRYSSF